MNVIKVLLADDHPALRAGIKGMLEKAGQWVELSQHTPERCRIWFWENVPSGTLP